MLYVKRKLGNCAIYDVRSLPTSKSKRFLDVKDLENKWLSPHFCSL